MCFLKEIIKYIFDERNVKLIEQNEKFLVR